MNKIATKVAGLFGFGHFDEQELKNKYLDQHSEFIEIDNLKIHYRKEGSGEPVVLIHGVLASLHTWDQWTAQLTSKFTVYRIDLPGFGFSTLAEESDFYRVDNFVESLGKLFDQLGLSRFHIAGNSLGGYIAWNYALARPEQIKSLTAIDSLCFKQKIPFLLKLPALPVIQNLTRMAVPKALIDFGVREVYGNRARINKATKQRYFDLLMRKGNKSSFVSVVTYLSSLAEHDDLGEGIGRLAVPTLVMWGAKDKWIPVALAHRWKSEQPDAQLLIYPDEGHVPMEESPQMTARDFTAFLLNNNS